MGVPDMLILYTVNVFIINKECMYVKRELINFNVNSLSLFHKFLNHQVWHGNPFVQNLSNAIKIDPI